MKKYIITQAQRDAIVWLLPDATALKTVIRSVLPIEPMSEKVAWDIAADYFNDEAPYEPVIAYALAIERYIIGSETP